MMNRLCFALAIALILSSGAPVHADVFLAGVDFSTTTNPNGAWSYGYRSTVASTDFTAYTISDDYPLTTLGWYKGWFSDTSGTIVPYVAKNVDDDPHGFATVPVILPGRLVLHPGNDVSVVRWTAPDAGAVDLLGIFTRLDSTPGFSSDVAVVHDGTAIYTGTISGWLGTDEHADTLSVASNSVIDFVVGAGSDGFTADSTALTGVINFTAVPEPTTLVTMCMALGTVGVIVTVRRRRRAA